MLLSVLNGVEHHEGADRRIHRVLHETAIIDGNGREHAPKRLAIIVIAILIVTGIIVF